MGVTPVRQLAVLAALGVVVAITGWFQIEQMSAQPALDSDLKQAREKLLLTYGTFKGYGIANAQDVYTQKLTPDRQALFDAVVRAAFVEIEGSGGKPTGKRVISFVEAVHGIWGVRPGDKEGRRMFRVSVRFAPGVRAALSASSNIGKSFSGHVLLPVAKGGDDDSTFTKFDIKESRDVVTFRQSGPRPNIQVSLLDADEKVGEIDLDFDSGCGPWPIKKCHCRPANSDFGSQAGNENHKSMFNQRVAFFSSQLASTWSSAAAHCKESY